jgi:hypothetical protein
MVSTGELHHPAGMAPASCHCAWFRGSTVDQGLTHPQLYGPSPFNFPLENKSEPGKSLPSYKEPLPLFQIKLQYTNFQTKPLDSESISRLALATLLAISFQPQP